MRALTLCVVLMSCGCSVYIPRDNRTVLAQHYHIPRQCVETCEFKVLVYKCNERCTDWRRGKCYYWTKSCDWTRECSERRLKCSGGYDWTQH